MKRLVCGLFILSIVLFGVAFVGVYETNVWMPCKSPFTEYVPSTDPAVLNLYLQAADNYDVLAVFPYQDGFIIVLRNRPKIIDMWQ